MAGRRTGSPPPLPTGDEKTARVRAMFDMMAAEKRLAATAIQTVGSKGWDGFALAVVAGK